jgi:hypothetical protein
MKRVHARANIIIKSASTRCLPELMGARVATFFFVLLALKNSSLSFKSVAAKRSFEAQKMPEIEERTKTCHECGLESIDDCETTKKHIPDDENFAPCVYCVRNHLEHTPTNWRADFYSERWYRDADKAPHIDDPDPHERQLLQTLHEIVQKEYAKLPEVTTS